MNNNPQNRKTDDLSPDASTFLHLVDRLMVIHPELTAVQAGIIVAADQNIARDSRTFSRHFGMAHAIVLRELNALLQSTDLLTLTQRDARTLRTHYVPGDKNLNIGKAERLPHRRAD
ncbi:hypothetical protein [Thalassospira australica]|uniref:hypothetical protein n=1 Tax=Thalassospira australica TaxID=1528106 RepID=UPI000AD46E24|nr:hypothetical protein [Thalassospira australica]